METFLGAIAVQNIEMNPMKVKNWFQQKKINICKNNVKLTSCPEKSPLESLLASLVSLNK